MSRKKVLSYRDQHGRLVPGATTILQCLNKPLLVPWAAKEAVEFVRHHEDMLATDGQLIYSLAARAHEDKRREGALRGEDAHMRLSAGLQSDSTDDPLVEAVRNATSGWQWCAQEVVVINTDLGYGGTADALAQLPGGDLVVVDYKTSSRTYPEHYLQLTMYAMATPQEHSLRASWMQLSSGRIILVNTEIDRAEVVDVTFADHAHVIAPLVRVHRWWREMQRWT